MAASNQFFNVSDPVTPIQALTVTDTLDIPPITALDDIRIRIPAGFNMVWDGSDTTATIGGSASGKVSTTVTYEDAGKTLVLDVTSDFVNGDAIVVSDLSFTTLSHEADRSLRTTDAHRERDRGWHRLFPYGCALLSGRDES